MKVSKEIITLINKLRKNNFQAYLVGGCVRDFIIGRKPVDYDITTDALPEDIMNIFDNTRPTGLKFGTVLVIINYKAIEVTTFRKDYETDGRHCKVDFSSDLIDDLRRRDFTINAIAYDTVKKEIIDPFNGRQDIKNKILRTIGEPLERLNEDYLRILRAVRFASLLGLKMTDELKEAIDKTRINIQKLSAERIREEIMKALGQIDKPSDYFRRMSRLKVLPIILPEIENMKDVEQNKYHLYDCFEHTLLSVDCVSKKYPLLRWIMLLHDSGKPICKLYDEKKKDITFINHNIIGSEIAENICRRLKFSKEETDKSVSIIKNHLYFLNDDAGESAVRRYIHRIGEKNIKDMFRFYFADTCTHADARDKNNKIIRFYKRIVRQLKKKEPLNVNDLCIGGQDLIEIGLEPSPVFSKILKHCLEIVLDDPSNNNKEVLMKKVREYIKEEGSSIQGFKDTRN